jgi:transcription elongation GreA/GreB family factor
MGFFLYKRPNYRRNILLYSRRIKEIREELDYLKVLCVLKAYQKARDKGDLSENAEYDAKEAQEC